MTRTRRLEPVVKHNSQKEQKALEALASSQAELDAEDSKLTQLKGYKTGYQRKQSDHNCVYSSLELQEFIRFLDQLDQTIKQQQEIVKLRQQELDARLRSWQATRIDSRKIQTVVENLHLQDQIRENRSEQKDLDEITQIKFRNS